MSSFWQFSRGSGTNLLTVIGLNKKDIYLNNVKCCCRTLLDKIDHYIPLYPVALALSCVVFAYLTVIVVSLIYCFVFVCFYIFLMFYMIWYDASYKIQLLWSDGNWKSWVLFFNEIVSVQVNLNIFIDVKRQKQTHRIHWKSSYQTSSWASHTVQ